MSTIRVHRRTRYTTVDRRAVNDERLSFRARGILAWLLDKPDDWRFDSESIARQGIEGRDAVRAALRELREAGYMIQRKVRGGDGRIVTETLVFEHPTEAAAFLSPEPGNPSPVPPPTAGEPAAGNPSSGAPGPLVNPETEDGDRSGATPREEGALFDCPQPAPQPVDLSINQRAQAIARAVYDGRNPRPVMPFPALIVMARRFLEAGHPDVALQRAMVDAPTITNGAVEFALNRGGRRQIPPPMQDRDLPERLVL